MKFLFFVFMVVVGQAAAPIPIPESFRPYAQLIEALYTTEGLTFADAVQMVEPMADELGALQEDPQTPHLLFLLTQKKVFEAELERLTKLVEADPENECLNEARFLIQDIIRSYKSVFFTQGDFTILNSGPSIADFFATTTTPITDIFPLSTHKLFFLMYISDFFGSISNIVNNPQFFKDDDSEKPFLEVFDAYLKKAMTKCGNKFFEHALWILREHVEFVKEKMPE